MKVLLIGNGGREHALAWKLSASQLVTSLHVLPGNPGTAQVAENVPGIGVTDFDKIDKFIRQNSIEFVVIGPEDPLALGLTDRIAKTFGGKVRVFGPNKIAAQLEGDKWFAKELMRQQAVPTGEARVFTDPLAAEEYVQSRDSGIVIKAAGLAKGKGVAVCHRTSDAMEAIDRIMRKRAFGEAGSRVVIEEYLSGPECSVLAFVDRHNLYLLETCQDHKAIEDGDVGPMTGGMGAYSPANLVTESMLRTIERDVFIPLMDGLIRDEIEYKGVLYAGLMLTAGGPKVLEFNCRFGDPETQPLMMRLQSDLAQTMLAVVDGKLDEVELKWDERPALCVVASSRGYPGEIETGFPITGINDADAMNDVKVFHAGTTQKEHRGPILTSGGRVLAVTAIAETIAQAHQRAYEAMSKIHFEGMYYRKDIGHQALRAMD